MAPVRSANEIGRKARYVRVFEEMSKASSVAQVYYFLLAEAGRPGGDGDAVIAIQLFKRMWPEQVAEAEKIIDNSK